ncbi:MAG: hypothetical protein N4A38_05380 [Candidatus Gracilibacteria bacterium]|nr:hypothetical protein [Candidatus Gracilibacteria bacterium]
MENLIIYLAVYILFILTVSLWFNKNNSEEDFLIAGRDRNSWQIMFSKYAGSVGASWFITYTGFAYIYGLSTFAAMIGYVAGYSLLALWFIPKIYDNAKKDKYITMGDYVYSIFKSKQIKKVIDILSVFIQYFWLLISIVGGANILSYLGLLSYEYGVLIIGLVVLIYILLAGFKAVIFTDFVQSIVIITLLFFIVGFLLREVSVPVVLSEKTGSIGAGTAIGFFLYGTLSHFAFSDRYQLIYASKTKKDAQRGLFFSMVPIFITGFLLILVGLFIHSQDSSLNTSVVFIEAMKNYLPSVFLPVGVVLFLAGIMSSSDSYIYAISSHISLLFGEKKSISRIRYITFGLIFITMLLALFYRDVVDLSVFAASFSLFLPVAMMYIISGGRSKIKFFSSIIIGFIGLIVGIVLLGVKPEVLLVTLIFSAIGLLTPDKLFNKK